ncbi:MAG: NYN domain-containing protein [Trebonia sp.]
MDRCALFVDAGYVLADGAMAVHGTRQRESVSWDYAGLLQLLGNLAGERCGLPVLRCYWYEVAVEGRRTPDHDALADLPGLKLRLGRMRPGRREGVDTEIHRDLSTLARNGAISDAVILSAEEDLTQVIGDVQDLGVRVTLAHIAVEGNWTISRLLRQECDAIIEILGAQLGPYVSLLTGAEASQYHEQYPQGQYAGAPLVNGHVAAGWYGAHAGQGRLDSRERPPAIYTSPATAPEHARRHEWPARPDVPNLQPGLEPVGGPAAQASAGQPASAGHQPSAGALASQQAPPGLLARRELTAAPSHADAPQQAQPQLYAAPTPALAAQYTTSAPVPQPAPSAPAAPPAQPALGRAPRPGTQGVPYGRPRRDPYSGPQPAVAGAAIPAPPPAATLADATAAAHAEGLEFGGAVARDQPALWLEAVLARKPRMPSDLEARLLQGSALPIDFLLHDEVRHALRRGFWDALERSRR